MNKIKYNPGMNHYVGYVNEDDNDRTSRKPGTGSSTSQNLTTRVGQKNIGSSQQRTDRSSIDKDLETNSDYYGNHDYSNRGNELYPMDEREESFEPNRKFISQINKRSFSQRQVEQSAIDIQKKKELFVCMLEDEFSSYREEIKSGINKDDISKKIFNPKCESLLLELTDDELDQYCKALSPSMTVSRFKLEIETRLADRLEKFNHKMSQLSSSVENSYDDAKNRKEICKLGRELDSEKYYDLIDSKLLVVKKDEDDSYHPYERLLGHARQFMMADADEHGDLLINQLYEASKGDDKPRLEAAFNEVNSALEERPWILDMWDKSKDLNCKLKEVEAKILVEEFVKGRKSREALNKFLDNVKSDPNLKSAQGIIEKAFKQKDREDRYVRIGVGSLAALVGVVAAAYLFFPSKK